MGETVKQPQPQRQQQQKTPRETKPKTSSHPIDYKFNVQYSGYAVALPLPSIFQLKRFGMLVIYAFYTKFLSYVISYDAMDVRFCVCACTMYNEQRWHPNINFCRGKTCGQMSF